MNVIWSMLAVLSFIGSQAYLVYLLRKLGNFLEHKPNNEPTFTYDDSCRYPEDVIE